MYMDVKSQHTEKAMDDHPRKIFLVNEHAEKLHFSGSISEYVYNGIVRRV